MNKNYSDIITVNKYILEHKEDFIKDIGKVLKDERIRKNITLEEVALRTQSSSSYVAQIEKGSYGLSLVKFITFCNALEINEKVLEKFLYAGKQTEDEIYYELQNGKNISQNILNYMKNKNNLVL